MKIIIVFCMSFYIVWIQFCYHKLLVLKHMTSLVYTTIAHTKLKDRLKTIITDCFFHKNGKRRYKYLVFNKSKIYFVQEQTKATEKYTENEIIKMLEFLVDNIFVEFGGQIFQQTIGFLWEQIALHCLLIYSYIHMRRTSCRSSSAEETRT